MRAFVALALVMGTSGCIPLPIPNTMEVSPAIRGRVVREDGSPLIGAPVAVAADPDRCDQPIATGTTDQTGKFSLPRVAERRKLYWLTLMHSHGITEYTLCAGEGPRAETRVVGHQESDELDCLTWTLEGRTQMECNTLALKSVISGGEWRSGSARGFYRIIAAEDPGGWWRSYGLLQWVTPGERGGRDSIRATIWIPRDGRGQYSVANLDFHQETGRWFLDLPSTSTAWPLPRRVLRFELGGPGELWRLGPQRG